MKPVTWELRAAFARALSAMYGREVPAYTTLVDVSREVNADVLGATGGAAERLGCIERVTAERHGAIRVGTAARAAPGRARLRRARHVPGRLLRPARRRPPAPVPVISTAFRPDRRRTSWPATRSASSPPARHRRPPLLRRRPAEPRWSVPRRAAAVRPRAARPRRPRRGRGGLPSGRRPLPAPGHGSVRALRRAGRPGLVRHAGARSRPSPPTSAASPPTTSTTSRRACSTSTRCTAR